MGKFFPGDDNEQAIPLFYSDSNEPAGAVNTNFRSAIAKFLTIRPKDREKDASKREVYILEIHGDYHATRPDTNKIVWFPASSMCPEELYIAVDLIVLTLPDNQAQLQHKLFGDKYQQAILGLEGNVTQADINAIGRGREVIKNLTDFGQQQHGGRKESYPKEYTIWEKNGFDKSVLDMVAKQIVKDKFIKRGLEESAATEAAEVDRLERQDIKKTLRRMRRRQT